MRPASWKKLRAEILSLYEPPQRAPATYREMRQIFDEFPAQKVRDLSPPKIAEWIKTHPDRSPARTASLLRCLAVIARYAVQARYLARDPFEFRAPSKWVRMDSRPSTRRILHRSPEQIGRLLDLLDREAAEGGWKEGRLQAMGYTFAYTGLRAKEGLTLERSDIDLVARTLTIQPKEDWRPKTLRSARTLPLALPLLDVLRLWMPRTGCQWVFPGVRLLGPWTGGPPGGKAVHAMEAAGERAGIGPIPFLGFRKTFGTVAGTWGLVPQDVQTIFGHTRVETQMHYREPDTEQLRPAMDRIYFPRARGAG
jgi:integrase